MSAPDRLVRTGNGSVTELAEGEQGRVPSRRVFIACPMPQAVIERIANLQGALGGDALRPSIRWVRPEGLHVTLRFLGPLSPETIDAVRALMDRAASAMAPITIGIGRAGAFPSLGRPRVLWLAVDDTSGSLGVLAQELERSCVRAGIVPDDRPFRPHATIGRGDGSVPAAHVARAMVERSNQPYEEVVVDSICLFESMLGTGPARYEVIHQASLGTRDG